MAEALLRVSFAGPLVTVQDGGRRGFMRFGVPASGPMDRSAHAAANVCLGNPADAPAVEISLGGLVLECVTGAVSMAVTGGDFTLDHAGAKLNSWNVLTMHEGEKLSIRAGDTGSWAYLAFAGVMRSAFWLGHAATHSMSGFGGGAITSGQVLKIDQARVEPGREGDVQRPPKCSTRGVARVVMGPQDRHFKEGAVEAFLGEPYMLTESYDRMGVRLAGKPLPLGDALSIPSEPILRGSVQVSGEGVPTVLLADHGTTGGYPKIATVISSDLDQFVQSRQGDTVRFHPIRPDQAVGLARSRADDMARYLEEISKARGTLSERLMRENLISGVSSGPEPDA